MVTNKFERDLLRGSLDLMVLSVLAGGRKYGYLVQKEVREASGGRVDLAAGTLYPLLHRLEDDGLVRADRHGSQAAVGSSPGVGRLCGVHPAALDARKGATGLAMTDSEFDNYIALLSRLLRLGGKQRDAIASELRAHLEDRLDDLLARGVPRDQAVRQALEEFGDAAGLAAEFVSISRDRRNRWIMRLTSISLAATILIAAGIFTFWPGGNAGPGRAAVVAQVPTRPAPGGPGHGAGGGAEAKPLSLTDKLNERLDVQFTDTPFNDVVEFLQDRTDIQFVIKRTKLEEAGVNFDTPITRSLKNVRLSTLLDVMLEELNLVYSEKDDLIVITTPDDAVATMEVRVYDCRDLLTMPTVGQARPGLMPGLMPGGPPTGFPGGSEPRRDSSLPGPGPGLGVPGGIPGGARGGVPGPVPDEGRAPGGFPGSAPGTPVGGRAPGGFPGSRESGAPDVAPSTPGAGVPAPGRPRPDILPQRGPDSGVGPALGGAIPGGGFGPPQGGGAGLGGFAPAGGGLGGEQRHDRPMTAEELKAEQLMNIITTAVDPNSWADVGGTGTIGEYNGLIVVSQSARTHSKIEKVLDMLREAAGLPKSKTPRVVR
jgi:PadR family transcriptional regulator/HAAS domain-containing protein